MDTEWQTGGLVDVVATGNYVTIERSIVRLRVVDGGAGVGNAEAFKVAVGIADRVVVAIETAC